MLFILIFYAELNVDNYGVKKKKGFSLSRKKKKKIESETIQWIKSRNCDIIEDK